MLNKFKDKFGPDRKLKKDRKYLYDLIRENILAKKEYKINLESEEKIEEFAASHGLSKEEVIIELLERFNREEGALPDFLGSQYIDLVYSQENIKKKMENGKSFYEVISEIDREVKDKNIFLNQDDVNRKIKELEKDLGQEQAA